MLTRLLRTSRLRLRGSAVGHFLRRIGVAHLGRRLYTRLVLFRRIHTVDLLGTRLRFSVRSVREIDRLDAFDTEETLARRFLEAIGPGDVVYDVGANIGTYSVLIGVRFGAAEVSVHAFEPEPANARELRRNLRLNGVANVVVHEQALGATSGASRLFVDGEAGSGAHSLVPGHTKSTRPLDIQVERADDFSARTGTVPAVVKIDVEGAEMDVLRGFEGLFDSGMVRDLLIELHPATLGELGLSPDVLTEWLRLRRYPVIWSQSRGQQRHAHFRRQD